MTLQEKIEAVCRNWARETAKDLKKSLEKALKEGQPLRRGEQEASLNFSDVVTVDDKGNANIKIVASGEYWINIEEGRGAGEQRPPSNVVGAKWQGKNAIKPQQILYEIELNAKKKLSKTSKGLSKPKKQLSFNEAAKRLSFIFAGTISKKGIKPKPFVDRVINDGRVKILTKKISEVIGQDISAELNLNNEFKKIKITV